MRVKYFKKNIDYSYYIIIKVTIYKKNKMHMIKIKNVKFLHKLYSIFIHMLGYQQMYQ